MRICLLTLFAALPPMAQATEEVMSLHVDPSDVISAGHVEAVGGVTSSGQPDAAALQVFAESGYVAVIDLRGENENRGIEDEQAVVESFGMEYVHLPITSQAAMSFENAGKLDELIDSFDGSVLVHCGSGNRVGGLLALRKSLGGASDEEALEHGREGGMTGTEPLVRQRLAEKHE